LQVAARVPGAKFLARAVGNAALVCLARLACREGKLELVVRLWRLSLGRAEAGWWQPGFVFGHPVKIARCGVLFHEMLSAARLWIKILSLCSYLTFPVDSFCSYKSSKVINYIT
jgi:hypothetical protein